MSDPAAMDSNDRIRDLGAARRVFAALAADEENGANADGLPVIPGYTLLGLLGQGGGGSVFRGIHEGSSRPVAVKLLARRLGSTAGSQRAWRELELLSQLHLPCLPKVLDYGEHEGRLFVVTELVEGLTLDAHCDERQLDRRQRVELLSKAADAVQLVHERGVIHRDVKPSNIIIDVHGDPVLIDFGIATLAAEDPKDTLATDGSPMGSPAFMAPEQARGERAAISTRTDVYGLGATAYQILLGQPPFDLHATLHEAIRRIAFEQPRGPRELDATIPLALAAVLHKAVARSAGNRYASAADFAADLRRWLRREPVLARPPSPFRRVTRALGQHPVAATLGLCLAMLACSAGGSFALTRWLNAKPYRVAFRPDDSGHAQGEAMLHSLSDRVRHTWSPGVTGAHKKLISHRDERGEHLLAIVGFEDSSEHPEWARKLCVFDVQGSVKQPYWSRGVTEDQLAPFPAHREIQASDFRVRNLDVQDYFPDLPGEEIAVIFTQGTYSWTVVQIYDLRGDLLYQFWHDGVLKPMHWLPGPGLIVLAGVNSEGVSGRGFGWGSRDAENPPDGSHPSVLFALRPRAGLISRTVLVADEVVDSDAGEVAWYRCLPRVMSSKQEWRISRMSPPMNEKNRRAEVLVAPRGASPSPEVAWIIDEWGHDLPGTSVANDHYMDGMSRGEITLPPEFWHLGVLPPLLPPLESSPAP